MEAGPSDSRMTLVSAASIVPSSVDWAIPGRVPMGCVTVVAGIPGIGKSMLTSEWAAQWSRGEAIGALLGQPVSIIIASAEDSQNAVIVPRLIAAKANLERIKFPELQRDGCTGGLLIPDDIELLRGALIESCARVLIIDPLMAHLPGTVNSYRDQDIRRALAPLATLVEELNVAVIVVTHLNKDQSKAAVDRVGGSIGIVAAARSVLLMARDPDDQEGDVRMCAHMKCNYARLAPTLKFKLEERQVGPDSKPVVTSAIVWQGEVTHMTAADLLAPPDQGHHADRSSKFEAIDW
jgi:RecA-family ATPase